MATACQDGKARFLRRRTRSERSELHLGVRATRDVDPPHRQHRKLRARRFIFERNLAGIIDKKDSYPWTRKDLIDLPASLETRLTAGVP